MKKRDVDETDDHYEVDIGLPGFRKDDLKLELNDNYLTVSAAKGQESGKKDKVLRRECFEEAMQLTYFVGKDWQRRISNRN